jgi:hypothetical protein
LWRVAHRGSAHRGSVHRGSMNPTILIMLVATVITTSIAWHGRGRWY